MSTSPHTSHTQCTPFTVGHESKTLKCERSTISPVEFVGSSESGMTRLQKINGLPR